MVKEINKDMFFLAQKSEVATENDKQIALDLLDTLKANSTHCVGLAANMIGERKCIIAIDDEGELKVMFNPEIIKSSDAFKTKESCLSLVGERDCKRYKKIKLKFQDINFKVKIKTFTDFTAQIIQHEVDHCNGIII